MRPFFLRFLGKLGLTSLDFLLRRQLPARKLAVLQETKYARLAFSTIRGQVLLSHARFKLLRMRLSIINIDPMSNLDLERIHRLEGCIRETPHTPSTQAVWEVAGSGSAISRDASEFFR